MKPMRDIVRSKTPRRTFWHAYLLGRGQGSATAWLMAIDDLDVGQEFPLPLADFENGLVTPDLLSHHDVPLTELFVLLLKANSLLSSYLMDICALICTNVHPQTLPNNKL